MDTSQIADELLRRAIAEGQAAHRITASGDVPAIRAGIRHLARMQGVRLRTGIVDEAVLAVVLVDAPLWRDPESVMRAKLSPPGWRDR